MAYKYYNFQADQYHTEVLPPREGLTCQAEKLHHADTDRGVVPDPVSAASMF